MSMKTSGRSECIGGSNEGKYGGGRRRRSPSRSSSPVCHAGLAPTMKENGSNWIGENRSCDGKPLDASARFQKLLTGSPTLPEASAGFKPPAYLGFPLECNSRKSASTPWSTHERLAAMWGFQRQIVNETFSMLRISYFPVIQDLRRRKRSFRHNGREGHRKNSKRRNVKSTVVQNLLHCLLQRSTIGLPMHSCNFHDYTIRTNPKQQYVCPRTNG